MSPDSDTYGTWGMGGYGVERRSWPSKIADPDEPTPEEIARAMNAQFVPCSALKGLKIARAIKRAELVAEGRQISQNPAHSKTTLMALANIVRIGTGR